MRMPSGEFAELSFFRSSFRVYNYIKSKDLQNVYASGLASQRMESNEMARHAPTGRTWPVHVQCQASAADLRYSTFGRSALTVPEWLVKVIQHFIFLKLLRLRRQRKGNFNRLEGCANFQERTSRTYSAGQCSGTLNREITNRGKHFA